MIRRDSLRVLALRCASQPLRWLVCLSVWLGWQWSGCFVNSFTIPRLRYLASDACRGLYIIMESKGLSARLTIFELSYPLNHDPVSECSRMTGDKQGDMTSQLAMRFAYFGVFSAYGICSSHLSRDSFPFLPVVVSKKTIHLVHPIMIQQEH